MNRAVPMNELRYYYWISSDWAYFGNPRMKALAERHGLSIVYRPVDLVTVYARTGGIELRYRSRERQAYRFVEMQRFSALLDMPIVLEPRRPPVDSVLPSCLLIAAEQRGIDQYALNHEVMKALWVEDRDIEDEAVLAEVIERVGLDAGDLLALARSEAMRERYRAYTEEAIEAGVFGAPFYLHDGVPFWGQDRLDLLDRHLTALRRAAA